MLLLGGCAKSALWRQIYADIFDRRVLYTPVGSDAAALGAAALAATGVEFWESLDLITRAHGLYVETLQIPENIMTYRRLLPLHKLMAVLYSQLGDRMHEEGLVYKNDFCTSLCFFNRLHSQLISLSVGENRPKIIRNGVFFYESI